MINFKFEIIQNTTSFLCKGAWMTLQLVCISFILAMIFGTLIGVGRFYSRKLYFLFAPYVEIFRGTPLLIQLFFLYYGLPTVGITMDSYMAACLGLGLNGGAYISEIIRSSLLAVDKNQQEAAYALGLNWIQAMIYIIFPQALSIAIAPLVNSFSSLLKETSLVSVLAITELTRVGQLVYTRTFRAFEIYLAIGLIYLIMTYCAAFLSKYLEKRYKIEEKKVI